MKIIPIIQKISKIKRDISENQTLISVILPVFKFLGWDVFNENRVIYEDMTSTKKRVDATFVFDDNSKFLLEAKRLSHKLIMKDFEQLTLYLNSDENANFGILTNGIDYWIADNKQDGLDAKRIYAFNIFDMSECDLNILRLFFSFDPQYKLKDVNRYINYVKTGLDFGDKICEKVLEIKNFENDDLLIAQKANLNLSDDKNASFKKPSFNSHSDEMYFLTNSLSSSSSENKIVDTSEQDKELNQSDTKIKNNSQSELSIAIQQQAQNQKQLPQNIKTQMQQQESVSQPQIQSEKDHSEIKNTVLSNSNNNVQQNNINSNYDEVIKVPAGKDKIEFFELIERNRAKIFLNNEYHIITDSGFPSLFIKMLRYIMKEIKLYPALHNKVIRNFSFIEEQAGKTGKYENISDGYFYNVGVNNYTKLKNIEALLKFIHENFE